MKPLKCWHVWTFDGEAWIRQTDESMSCREAGKTAANIRRQFPNIETRLELESFKPLAVGDTVKHGPHVIQGARDYFQSCGREPMREGARLDLEKKMQARGVIESVRTKPDAVFVRWNDGHVSDCLSYCVEKVKD